MCPASRSTGSKKGGIKEGGDRGRMESRQGGIKARATLGFNELGDLEGEEPRNGGNQGWGKSRKRGIKGGRNQGRDESRKGGIKEQGDLDGEESRQEGI